jgi:oligopeptide transport system permease protein
VSAVLAAPGAATRSEGVWAAAWRRFRGDRVGMVSMVIVAGFAVLMALAGLGLVAADWQLEKGVPNAPPTFMGPAKKEASAAIPVPTGPNVDISAVDPLAPRYAEWTELAKKYQTTEAARAETLPFGGDRLGRDVLSKAIKGAQISVFVGVLAALVATLIGTVLGALAGF